MRIELLSRIINDSEILKTSFLSEKEKFMILQFVREKKEVAQIARELNFSGAGVRQILNSSINKIILGIDDLIFKAKLLDQVMKEKDSFELENRDLKLRFKKYLENENQMKMDFDVNETIEILQFSVRAKRVLGELNIKKVRDLSQLTLNDLSNKTQIGRKTIAEIISKSENYGIKIN